MKKPSRNREIIKDLFVIYNRGFFVHRLVISVNCIEDREACDKDKNESEEKLKKIAVKRVYHVF